MSRLQECRRKRAVTATEIGTHTEIAWRVTAAPYFHNGAAEKGLVTQHQGDAWPVGNGRLTPCLGIAQTPEESSDAG